LLCTKHGGQPTLPKILVRRPPAANRLSEESLGGGGRGVKSRKGPPQGEPKLKFACQSRSFSAPSPFWSTMAHPSRVGANWSGSHTSGFLNGPAAAPISGARAKLSS